MDKRKTILSSRESWLINLTIQIASCTPSPSYQFKGPGTYEWRLGSPPPQILTTTLPLILPYSDLHQLIQAAVSNI